MSDLFVALTAIALLMAIVVASGGRDVARVLVPVYEALGLDWDPATSGSVCR